ncbi:alpha/beta fold hydrolase [Nesterenkonia sp.]|uniref:S9 family peptidase n=1 Tax=Nesterenkonia sp. TaxID=704201 RepID=UPI00262CEAD2|nr:alpha/beta fold hydrolase [Nesterenkonia sp.]
MADQTFTDLDHYVAHPRIASLALSPDGRRLVTTVQTLNTAKDGYVTALWEVDPEGERPARRLTRSAKGEASPVFSADGDLYFTSARPDEQDNDDDTALWCLPAGGGEAYVVNRRPGGVESVACARNADVVAVTASVLPGAQTEQEHQRLHSARKDSSVKAILHSGYPVRFWDHDLGPARSNLFVLGQDQPQEAEAPAAAAPAEPARRSLRRVTEQIGDRFGGDVHISPDGSFALFALRIPEAGADMRSAVARVDLRSGQWEVLLDDPNLTHTPGIISPDSRRAVVGISRRPTPEQAMRPVLHLLDLDSGELTALTEDVDLWLTPADWLPDGSGFLALADENGRGPIFRVDVEQRSTTRLTSEDSTYSEVRVSPDGTTAYGVRSSYAFPSELARIDLATGDSTRLPNPAERPQLPGTLTEVETTAEDGARLRAWLALPAEAAADSPAPMLLWIHGGPLNSWNAWTWRWNPWLAVAKGYAVLLPDPALSTGYGQDFIQRGWNSWGDKPYTDLMSITDAAVAREDIDETRTAAMGGSFGGYMANWVAGHTDRFRAIVTHASLWALDQFGPTTDMSPFWRRQIDAAMEEQHSPHRHVEKITSPMLVIHGDKDYRVPIGEGLRLWYELLERSGRPMDDDGATDHRFLYFPDENHWILKPQHAKVWYQVVFAFLAEHVLGRSEELPAELGLTTPQTADEESAAGSPG